MLACSWRSTPPAGSTGSGARDIRDEQKRLLYEDGINPCFAFVREGLHRYLIEHTRLSLPLPGDTWWHQVDLDLPSWTVAADIDLRQPSGPARRALAEAPERTGGISARLTTRTTML